MATAVAQNWADELPQTQVTDNGDGTKTVVSFTRNQQGKKVKITKRIRETIVKEEVVPAVAQRRKWSRFGEEKDNTAVGPDTRTTMLDDPIDVQFGEEARKRKEEEVKKRKQTEVTKSLVVCRLCQGDHFTTKCPFIGTLGVDPESNPNMPGNNGEAEGSTADVSGDSVGSGLGGSGSSYVPPHLRGRGGAMPRPGPGERIHDDSTTIRITQLNEVVDEQRLRMELCAPFGNITKATVVRNRETGRSKGVAFVAFETEQEAQLAIDRLNNRGYLSLILKVDWSKPKPKV
ncbi:hypothetical protein LJB42_003142 [Komagataella kurtzmanii]|nr:hypothetical protein LJB42_003142 [Komagataella kurtzmanii]